MVADEDAHRHALGKSIRPMQNTGVTSGSFRGTMVAEHLAILEQPGESTVGRAEVVHPDGCVDEDHQDRRGRRTIRRCSARAGVHQR
jgi:hypothetical protein